MDTNNNNAQYVDINEYDSNQYVPNDDGSNYNGNHKLNQKPISNSNESPMQFNAMLLESYDSSQNTGKEQPTDEEFYFPFSQELGTQPE